MAKLKVELLAEEKYYRLQFFETEKMEIRQ